MTSAVEIGYHEAYWQLRMKYDDLSSKKRAKWFRRHIKLSTRSIYTQIRVFSFEYMQYYSEFIYITFVCVLSYFSFGSFAIFQLLLPFQFPISHFSQYKCCVLENPEATTTTDNKQNYNDNRNDDDNDGKELRSSCMMRIASHLGANISCNGHIKSNSLSYTQVLSYGNLCICINILSRFLSHFVWCFCPFFRSLLRS